MSVLKVNVVQDRPVIDAEPDFAGALRARLARLPEGAPVALLVHGYKFSPSRPELDPHDHILSDGLPRAARAVSWPRHLGFGGGDERGLAITLGWESDGTIWRAYDQAERAGRALAEVLAVIDNTGRRADAVSHSLGARVVLSALPLMPPGALNRAILLAPAEFRRTARAALTSVPARKTRVLQVRSRENSLFDGLFRAAMAPRHPFRASLGGGIGPRLDNWTDLRIDAPEVLAALAALGHRIAPPDRRICHWSAYLRPGTLRLYRAILSGALPLALLSETLDAARAPTGRSSRQSGLQNLLMRLNRGPKAAT